MENETDEVVSGVSTLSMAVERSGPLSFADICDLGAEVAGSLATQHDDGDVHGHVAAGSVVRLDDGPWRLAPSSLVPDVEPVTAPELAPGADPTPASDVYALGAVLSFGLTGEPVEPIAPTEAASAVDTADVDTADLDTADLDTADLDTADLDGDELNLELTPEDLDRLSTMGRSGSGVDAPATDADAADGEGSPDIDLTDEPDGAPMTLPEVMSSFLVVLRATLAADPVDRPSATSLAATLRQLRSDADAALGGALVAGAVVIGDGHGGGGGDPWADDDGAPLPPPPVGAAAAGAAAAAALTFDGTGSAASLTASGAKPATKKTLKDRLPVLVAAAAVLVALFLGVSLLRERGDQSADLLATGPTAGTVVRRTTTTQPPSLSVDIVVETTTTLPTSTTTSTSTTVPVTTPETVPETTLPSTTLPSTTLPSTTLPPTTTTTRPPQVGIPVTVTCGGTPVVPCPAKLYSEPSTLPPSAVVQQAPNGATLSAQCARDAEQVGDSKVWLRIIGPGSFFWIPKAAVSYSATVPPCSP